LNILGGCLIAIGVWLVSAVLVSLFLRGACGKEEDEE
jgi:hypothetical protein